MKKTHFNSLREITPILTARLCIDEKNLSEYQRLGINPNEWPSSDERSIVSKYLSARKRSNHKLALNEVVESITKLKADNQDCLDQIAFEKAKHDYQILINRQRVQDLIFNLQMDVDRADEHVIAFQSKKSNGIAVIDVFDQAENLHNKMMSIAEEGKTVVKIPDWPFLSDAIGGFNPGRVGMLIARTGFGKTAFGLNFAISAQKEMRTLFINMEMIDVDIYRRISLLCNNVEFKNFAKGKDFPTLEKVKEKQGKGLLLTEGKSLTLEEIKAITRTENQKEKLGMLIIDYDQKIDLTIGRDMQEWKALQIAVSTLEELAKELKIYILVFAQESSEQGKISGSFRSTFSAATVMRFFKSEETDQSYIVADMKNRFGPIGEGVRVIYNGATSEITEVEAINWNKMKKEKVRQCTI